MIPLLLDMMVCLVLPSDGVSQPCSLFILMFSPPTDHMSIGDAALSSVRLELDEGYPMAPSLPPSSDSESMEEFDIAASDHVDGQDFEDLIQMPSSPPKTQSAASGEM
jgi:hypothetical protein